MDYYVEVASKPYLQLSSVEAVNTSVSFDNLGSNLDVEYTDASSFVGSVDYYVEVPPKPYIQLPNVELVSTTAALQLDNLGSKVDAEYTDAGMRHPLLEAWIIIPMYLRNHISSSPMLKKWIPQSLLTT